MQAMEAIVPLANGYVQVMKTSQCQATDLCQQLVFAVLLKKQQGKNGGSQDEHEDSAKVLSQEK